LSAATRSWIAVPLLPNLRREEDRSPYRVAPGAPGFGSWELPEIWSPRIQWNTVGSFDDRRLQGGDADGSIEADTF
jgi:hypothetical protein